VNTVYFDTPGLLDMRAVTTFGLSVKENENPIGYFGTGLKYAIAILMRNGATVTINTSSGDRYEFSKHMDTFRSKEYEAIAMRTSMRNVELPFTTELGRNWKMWMAFRELYCNTQDEKGVTHIGDGDEREGGRFEWDTWTRITIYDKDFYEAYANRHDYFIETLKPAYVGTGMEVFNKPSAHMFYKRIRTGDLRVPSIMTYNYIRFLDLTEDRTIQHTYIWDQGVTGCIARSTDEDVIRKFVLAPMDTYEASAVFSEYITAISDEFKAVMKPLAHDLSGRVNASAQDLYIKFARKTGEAFVFVDLTPVQESMLTKAAKVCTDFGHDPTSIPIHFVKSLGAGVLGTVKREKIYISIETFEMGTKMLAGTLMEELIHHETGLGDMCRGMQNYLINRIMSMYEDNKGEPL
jgi:hypothetical protein